MDAITCADHAAGAAMCVTRVYGLTQHAKGMSGIDAAVPKGKASCV